MKVIYPFAAVPNQLVRGGHGLKNLCVLVALLSHGKTTASAATLAREIGCDRKSIFAAIKYWVEEGPKHGVYVRGKGKVGRPTIYEIEIERMEDVAETRTENGTGRNATSAENGTRGVPETEHPPVPKTVHKEEPLKKNKEEDFAPTNGAAEITQVFERFQKLVNPTINYGNITQRKAAEALLKAFGLDDVLRKIDYAASIYGLDYAPTIATPLQLKDKLPQLLAYQKKHDKQVLKEKPRELSAEAKRCEDEYGFIPSN